MSSTGITGPTTSKSSLFTSPPTPEPEGKLPLPPSIEEKTSNEDAASQQDSTRLKEQNQRASRRLRPGSSAAQIAKGVPLVPLDELDSAFQLQEYLKSLHAHHTQSPERDGQPIAINHKTAQLIAQPPPGVDRSLWLYELTRLFVARTNALLVGFYAESPPCSPTTCPEMRASEWQYLCAVHEPPKACCAIDYSTHTLDWASHILTSPRHFPSRLSLSAGRMAASENREQTHLATSQDDSTTTQMSGIKQLTNIMRRVYRIFSHAWYSHRAVFWAIEAREGLHLLFKTVTDEYELMPEESYTIPPEAEGLTTDVADGDDRRSRSRSPRKLASSSNQGTEGQDEGRTAIFAGAGLTQRRHKASPSLGSAVTIIHEGDEEDGQEYRDPASTDTEHKKAGGNLSEPESGEDATTQNRDPEHVKGSEYNEHELTTSEHETRNTTNNTTNQLTEGLNARLVPEE